MLNDGFEKFFPQCGFKKSLYDHYVTLIAAGKFISIDSNKT